MKSLQEALVGLLIMGATACSTSTPATNTTEVHVDGNAGAKETSPGPSANSEAPQQHSRNVVINDLRLSDDEVARNEEAYRIKIVDADYWYDKATGAWGIKGGPTRGFILSNLELGGPLKRTLREAERKSSSMAASCTRWTSPDYSAVCRSNPAAIG